MVSTLLWKSLQSYNQTLVQDRKIANIDSRDVKKMSLIGGIMA